MNDPIRSSDDANLVAAVEAYAKAVAEGRRPDRQALLDAHPQVAGELNACLDALELVHRFVPDVSDSVARRTSPPDSARQEPDGEVSGLATLGNFRLLRQIGRGGMGVVYKAQQIDLKRRVALKVLPFAAMLDRRQLTRFKNEAQAAAGLHHTNIVPVYSFGCQDGVYYYAMQYIEGQTLGQVIAGFPDRTVSMPESPQRPFALGEGAIATESMELPQASPSVASPEQPESIAEHDSQPVNRDATPPWLNDSSWKSVGWCRRVAEMGIQVAEALEYAHQQGILHRDVKPGNLLLDVEGSVWVTDFGLAQIEAGTKLTLTGDVLGTLRYMSPEQAGGGSGRVDCRSDVYSLGITLYELLTLRPAFSQQRRELLLVQVLSEDPPPSPSRLNRAIPRDLETIVQKATAKVPAERYETAADLADDLRRFLDGRPIRARRPSPLDRLAKWTRRHAPIAVTTAAFVAVLAVSLLLLSIRHAAREHEARVEAEEARRDSEAARIDAETAQRGAESARVAAETVTGYLVDAFRSPDPQRDGRTITVAEVLDRTVQELEGQFADQPLIKASLLDALGQSYHGLGLYRQSESLYEEALELRQQVLGREHPDTLAVMDHLAGTYRFAGRYDDAIRLNEETLQLSIKHLGPEHPDTLSCMGNLAGAYRAAGRYDEAVRLNKEVLKLRREHLGVEHPSTAVTMNNLAAAYLEFERYLEAIPLLEETLRLFHESLGAEHPQTLSPMNNLANAYGGLGKHREAVELHEEVVRLRREHLGAKHPSTLLSMQNLILAYQAANRHKQASLLLEECIALNREVRPGSAELSHSLSSYIAYLLADKRYTEAEECARECLAIRREHMPDDWLTYNALCILARSLVGQKRFDEAEPLLLEAYNELMAREEHIPAHATARLTEAQDAIIQMYQDWDKPDKAEQWRRQHFKQYVLLLDRLPPDAKTDWQHPRSKLARRIAESDDVFARVIEARPDDGQLWIERGRMFALRSRWSEAVEAYRRADLPGIPIEAFELACALLLSGDQEGYRELCVRLSADADQFADPLSAFHLAWITGIGPSGIEPERMIHWAVQMVELEGRAWHLHVLALAHYRAGNYVDTIRHFQQSNAQGWHAGLLNHWLLAMTHHQLGNSLAAANAQAQAESLAANWMSKESGEPISNLPPPDWVSLHLLRRQFQELQSGAAAGSVVSGSESIEPREPPDDG